MAFLAQEASMNRLAHTGVWVKALVISITFALLVFTGGCGSGGGTIVGPTRQVAATYNNLDGTTFVPDPQAIPGERIVCTVNAAAVPGAPPKIQLSYTVSRSGGPATPVTDVGPAEATLRNGRYRFFLETQGDDSTLNVYVGSTAEVLSLPPVVTPPLPGGAPGGGGPGTGIPIFTTNLAGAIIVEAASNSVVTLTIDASSVAGSPDVAPLTYSGPISGPSQVTKVADQYVFDVTTGTVTQDTPTSVTIGPGGPFTTGNGPIVQAP
jgi:hypothetical protein